MACHRVNFTSFTHFNIILPIRLRTRNRLLVRAATTFCNFFDLKFQLRERIASSTAWATEESRFGSRQWEEFLSPPKFPDWL